MANLCGLSVIWSPVVISDNTYIVAQNTSLSLIKDALLKRLKVQPVMCSAGHVQPQAPGGWWVSRYLSASTQPVPGTYQGTCHQPRKLLGRS